MKVNIHSIKFDSDEKLLHIVQKKLDKLDTFFDKIINGEVYMRLNNEGINNKTVEIKINIPGDQLFATASSTSFEAATDEASQALKRQIKRYKEKAMDY